MQAPFPSEQVLHSMYDARLARSALAADVLEVLLALLFLQSCAALVKEHRR